MPAPTRQLRRGHGRSTLRDVAEAAGVTSITVSRFLREPALVAEETAVRVRAALVQTGYVPNKQAGLLASGVSNIVAALLPNLANSIFAETAQGLSDTLQAAGHELLIASTGYSLEREEEQLRALLGWHPAAVVVTGRRHSPGAQALLASAQQAGTPVIEIWDWQLPSERAAQRAAGSRNPFTQIGFSHDEVGRAMAQHLLDAGHRHLAYVDSGIAEDYRAHERGLGFAARARSAGAEVSVLVAPPGDPFNAGREMLQRLLAGPAQGSGGEHDGPGARAGSRRGRGESSGSGTGTGTGSQGSAPRPSRTAKGAGGRSAVTAAAFANDHLASGALLEAARQRVAIPGRLALLGFGDFAWSRQLDPALSSVALPRYDIGVAAAQALLAARRGTPPAERALQWQLVARASTAARR
ncbi:MAG: LacI family DNA-binding transcriptional regulator [Rubrivivax sp.]|nr:LacI family DNA-binding transcriptional regulator [Rubrivivax sp.]